MVVPDRHDRAVELVQLAKLLIFEHANYTDGEQAKAAALLDQLHLGGTPFSWREAANRLHVEGSETWVDSQHRQPEETLTALLPQQSGGVATPSRVAPPAFSTVHKQGSMLVLGSALFFALVFFAVAIVFAVEIFWKIFSKAGRPGYYSLIPVYNLYVMGEVCGYSGWLGILQMVPVVGVVIGIIFCLALARKFGYSTTFGVGIILLPWAFLPVLAFGKAKYLPNA